MKNTSWYLLTLQEIERIEQRLENGKFAKGETSISSEKKWRAWITHTIVYSSCEESVAIYKYEMSIFGHPIYYYDRGDVVIRICDENYRKILLDLPV